MPAILPLGVHLRLFTDGQFRRQNSFPWRPGEDDHQGLRYTTAATPVAIVVPASTSVPEYAQLPASHHSRPWLATR